MIFGLRHSERSRGIPRRNRRCTNATLKLLRLHFDQRRPPHCFIHRCHEQPGAARQRTLAWTGQYVCSPVQRPQTDLLRSVFRSDQCDSKGETSQTLEPRKERSAHTPRLGKPAKSCQKPHAEKEGLAQPRRSGGCGRPSTSSGGGWCGWRGTANPVVSLSNHGDAGNGRPSTSSDEAGVRGESVGLVGTVKFRSGNKDVRVTYYLFVFVSEVLRKEKRKRRWCAYDEDFDCTVWPTTHLRIHLPGSRPYPRHDSRR